ncbi:MAG: fimbrillin family protein [Bacteroidales bacterium]|nr:fimbrillin family protein [Bacteroidales bacterium]
MKFRILISLIVAAALAACTKSAVEYETAGDIGFAPATGKMTKTAAGVNADDPYPTSLNMYIYATSVGNADGAADYINGDEFWFSHGDNGTNLWAGRYNVYPWPNTFNLHFAGYSKSGNIGVNNGAVVTYDFGDDKLTVKGYTPGDGFVEGLYLEGANDLMYFPSTKTGTPGGFGKNPGTVPVEMKHTCSWISFIVKGDELSTGTASSTYTVDEIKISGIYTTGNLTCTGTDIEWDFKTSETPTYYQTTTQTVLSSSKPLAGTAITPLIAEDVPNNTILIPQKPGKLELKYTGSGTAYNLTEDKALDLKITTDPDDAANLWEPGKHYTYTITIKANEIQINPNPILWSDENWPVTVE